MSIGLWQKAKENKENSKGETSSQIWMVLVSIKAREARRKIRIKTAMLPGRQSSIRLVLLLLVMIRNLSEVRGTGRTTSRMIISLLVSLLGVERISSHRNKEIAN